jgi:curli biogenesis system outer membrane secretion channel CsgG
VPLSRRRFAAILGAAVTLGSVPVVACAQAGTSRRIAIVCEPDDDDSGPVVSRFQTRLGGALLRTGRFTLVDRVHLDRVLREQALTSSAYADPQTAARLGKLVGAQRFLNVELTAKAGVDRGSFVTTISYHVDADYTLVDVSTSGIVSSGSADGQGDNKVSSAQNSVSTVAVDDLRRQAIDACVDDLVAQLSA